MLRVLSLALLALSANGAPEPPEPFIVSVDAASFRDTVQHSDAVWVLEFFSPRCALLVASAVAWEGCKRARVPPRA